MYGHSPIEKVYEVHDAGQFLLPRKGGWNKKEWGDLALKFGPEVLQYGRLWADIEKEMGRVPRSLNELRNAPLSGAGRLGLLGQLYKLDGEDLDEYSELMEEAKPGPLADGLVLARIPYGDTGANQGGPRKEFVLQVVPHDDPIGPMLGLVTNCCQHLSGAGRKCAKHGTRSPLGGFVVVRKVTVGDRHRLDPVTIAAGEVIAQSWYWVGHSKGKRLGDNPDELCFDNIEVLGGFESRAKEMVRLYEEGAASLLKRGYKKVTVGCDYTELETPWKKANRPLKPIDYNGYRDSKRQYLVDKERS